MGGHIYRLRFLVSVAAALVTSSICGCSRVVPAFDIPYPVSQKNGPEPNVSSIVTRIQCELADIADRPGVTQFEITKEKVIALVELSLTVTDDGALAPTAIVTNGLFSFGTGLKFDQSRAQNFTENLSFNLADLRGSVTEQQCQFRADTNLAGNLGLRQMWSLANSSGPYADWSKQGSTGAFGGSISFTVDKELTATGPTWKLAHFTGPGALLSAYDKNVDKITIGFAKGKGAAVSAQKAIDKVKQNQQIDALQMIANAQK